MDLYIFPPTVQKELTILQEPSRSSGTIIALLQKLKNYPLKPPKPKIKEGLL